MRIALFNIDSLASNAAVRKFIDREKADIVLLGQSPPFRRARGSSLAQRWRHIKRSGWGFSSLLAHNFQISRHVGRLGPKSATLAGLCEKHGIRVEPIEDVNAPEVERMLVELDVDVIVSCYFDQIIKQHIIDVPKHGILNVHSSLLPEHRGPMPVIHGCLDDPPSFGVTIHAIDAHIDTGPIFAQQSYEPPPGHSVLAMMTDLHIIGVELLFGVLDQIRSGEHPPEIKSQDGGSYQSFPDREAMERFRATNRKLIDRKDVARAFRTPMRF